MVASLGYQESAALAPSCYMVVGAITWYNHIRTTASRITKTSAPIVYQRSSNLSGGGIANPLCMSSQRIYLTAESHGLISAISRFRPKESKSLEFEKPTIYAVCRVLMALIYEVVPLLKT